LKPSTLLENSNLTLLFASIRNISAHTALLILFRASCFRALRSTPDPTSPFVCKYKEDLHTSHAQLFARLGFKSI